MIDDVDECLRQLLADGLKTTPGCPVTQPDQIVLRSRGDQEISPSGPTVNLYLHHIQENALLRDDAHMRTRRTGEQGQMEAGIRRGSIYLDMSYLITVETPD